MNVVFFGSGEFGLPTLQRLAREHTLLGVVSQPDRPAGRGGAMTPTPIAAWAAENLSALPLIKPEKVSDPSVVARLRELAHVNAAGTTDTVFVVIAFGQKMPRELLDGIFAINLHASLLPRWRGAAPINAAILAGDAETGNSVITLADRMDAGLVLGQTKRAIEPLMTAGELHDLLSADGPELVSRVLAEHLLGAVRAEKQDESLVTKAAKLSKKDGMLDLSVRAEEARRRVHGLTPWPGVTVGFGGQALKLLRVQVVQWDHEEGGGTRAELRSIADVKSGLVVCGGGTVLRLLEVQPAGKRGMKWEEFVRGRKMEPGERLTVWQG